MKLLIKKLKLSKKEKRLAIFLGIIVLCFGYILAQEINIDVSTNILESLQNNHLNFLFIHVVVISILITSALLTKRILLFWLYFIFELSCISYILWEFSNSFFLKGLLYGILYSIVSKLIYFVCLIIIYRSLKLIIKEQGDLNKYYKILGASLLIIIIYDFFLYLWGSSILFKLTFIIS